MRKTIRRKIYDIIATDREKTLVGKIFDIFIIILIIFNVLLVILDTFNGFSKEVYFGLKETELFSIIIFTIEYLLRLWTADFIYPDLAPAKARLKYAFSFMAIIDFLAVLPFYIPFIIPIDLRVLRMVRLFRLLRIMKINRYTNALTSIGSVLKRKASQLISSMLVVFVLMVIASVLMYNIEYTAQPDVFQNAFSGLWWAIATLTTVGYGDIYPVTVLGKILSAIIALLGIGIVAVPTGIISAGFMENMEEKKTKDETKELAKEIAKEIIKEMKKAECIETPQTKEERR